MGEWSGVDASALPHRPGTKDELLRLGVFATSTIGAITAAWIYVALLVERSDVFSPFAPFGGWQFYLVAGLVAGAVLATAAMGGRWLLTSYRALRGRTKHRRVMILAALLPGVLLGSLAESPMHQAMSWASNHTAAAAAARQSALQRAADYRKAPPAMPSFDSVAPPSLARRLLRTAQLGPGWYDGMRPNPALRSGDNTGLPGETTRVRGIYSQEHWTGSGWQLDSNLFESMLAFSTARDASDYLDGWMMTPTACPGCPPVRFSGLHRERIQGLPIWERTSTSGIGSDRDAAFELNNTVFTVINSRLGTVASSKAIFEQQVQLAVRAALGRL